MNYSYINNQNSFNDFLYQLQNCKVVAIDTEFIHKTTYFAILSTIQIAIIKDDKKQLFIVDCLCDIDLEGFCKVIANEKITKIFHSPKQDLKIFLQKSDLIPKNIVDTQIMANFCNIGFNIGYSGLVKKFFKIELNKFQQNSNWQTRPLSTKQIEYALLDVEYLHQIYQNLKQELEKLDRYNWFLEEMNIFLEKITNNLDENLFKPYFFKNKNASEIFVIKKLILFREEKAKELNIPRQHFLRDEEIENIVVNQKISTKFDKKTKEKFLEILHLGLEIENNKELQLKNYQQIVENKNTLLKAKDFINFTANKLQLKGQILLTTSDLKTIINEPSQFRKKIFGWRFKVFGKELQKIINIL